MNYKINLTYSLGDDIIKTTDTLGRQVNYEYDILHNLTKQTVGAIDNVGVSGSVGVSNNVWASSASPHIVELWQYDYRNVVRINNSFRREFLDVNEVVKKGEKIFGELIYKAFPLMKYGIEGSHEFAWESENVFNAIEILKGKKILIIGGDVCLIKNKRIEYIYDNWALTNDELKGVIEESYKKNN